MKLFFSLVGISICGFAYAQHSPLYLPARQKRCYPAFQPYVLNLRPSPPLCPQEIQRQR
jgi:hypothetical protein